MKMALESFKKTEDPFHDIHDRENLYRHSRRRLPCHWWQISPWMAARESAAKWMFPTRLAPVTAATDEASWSPATARPALPSPSLVVTECRSGLGGAGDLHPEQNGARPRNGLVLHHWQHKQRSVQCRPCKPRALCALRQSEQPCHPWLRVPGHCTDDDASQQGAAMFPLCRTVPYKISRIRSSLLANALALAAASQPSRQV